MSRQIKLEDGSFRFDNRVHIMNADGKLVKKQPYSLRICKLEGTVYTDTVTGKKYHPNGVEIAKPVEIVKHAEKK